jgi:hypothetical protein
MLQVVVRAYFGKRSNVNGRARPHKTRAITVLRNGCRPLKALALQGITPGRPNACNDL